MATLSATFRNESIAMPTTSHAAQLQQRQLVGYGRDGDGWARTPGISVSRIKSTLVRSVPNRAGHAKGSHIAANTAHANLRRTIIATGTPNGVGTDRNV
jgi:hypothetical protein